MIAPNPWPDPSPVDDVLLSQLRRGVVEYDEVAVKSACQTIINRSMDAYMAIFKGLVEGMDEVGRLFDSQEYFVPELLMCADALYAGLNMLKPHIKYNVSNVRLKKEVVIGAIEGDIHDIGKNMLKMVFDIAGFTVRDLGRDTSISRFVEEVVELDSPLVLISCMLSTCGPRVKELISRLKVEAPNAIIMAGGAFIDDRASKRMGAHGGARNAHNALREAIRMLSAVNKIEYSSDEQNKPSV
jgi:methanogenic corrinoid protein MtbC1